MDTKTIKVLKTLSTALVIAVMIFAFLIAGIRIFGVQVYGVLTGSMEPTHPTGSLIYVKRTDASELRVNDVITFSISPNVIATHRIVEIVPDENNPAIVRYRTKGDANNDVDAALVSESNIIGKVMFSIPQLGNIANFIQQPPGIYVAILACGLMIAFVFYTDSLGSKPKTPAKLQNKRGYSAQKPQAVQQFPYAQQNQPAQQGVSASMNAYPGRNGYPQQGGYPQQNSYPQQNGYYPQGGQPQPNVYYNPNAYPQQGVYNRPNGSFQQNNVPRQIEYPQQTAYPPQKEYPRPSVYPPQKPKAKQ